LVLGWKEINGTLTFILSRKGREELKEYPPHPDPLPQGEKGLAKVKLGIGEF
jgi:hypothetical protein